MKMEMGSVSAKTLMTMILVFQIQMIVMMKLTAVSITQKGLNLAGVSGMTVVVIAQEYSVASILQLEIIVSE